MKPRSLAIGIPVRNRRHLVEFNAFSVSRMKHPPGMELRLLVLDDASTDFGPDLLRRIYPAGAAIIRKDGHSGGADHAAVELMRRLLALRTDAVMLLDSDFILRPDVLLTIRDLLPRTDGILSLFNTDSHAAYQEQGPFLLKKSVGSAGTVWTRERAQEVLAHVAEGPRWDWRFCEYLVARGVPIFCLRNSAVQHLGFAEGQNSTVTHGDYGNGFTAQVSDYLYFITGEIVRSQRRGFGNLDARLRKVERVLAAAVRQTRKPD